ncbi:MAG TPA: hypothetical protein VH062_37460 [Polyangiaceae bacterium]|nr:hypothetical protein [Polyangiaceae bacterium]
MAKGRSFRASVVAVVAWSVIGCGGGAPLLHPAHVLPFGRVSAGAGVSGQFAFHGTSSSRAPEQRGFEDSVARATLSPGVAPWAGVRGGFGEHFEGGLTYTGRSVRADARRAFGSEAIALSVGAGASAVFSDPDDRRVAGQPPPSGRVPLSGPDLHASGYGFDVPVIFGWRSTASVVQGWVGVRGGVEHLDGELPLAPLASGPTPQASVTATRWYGGGLAGAAIGLPPLMVALEVDIAYQAVTGSASFPGPEGPPAGREGTLHGLTVAPAGAIIGKF